MLRSVLNTMQVTMYVQLQLMLKLQYHPTYYIRDLVIAQYKLLELQVNQNYGLMHPLPQIKILFVVDVRLHFEKGNCSKGDLSNEETLNNPPHAGSP